MAEYFPREIILKKKAEADRRIARYESGLLENEEYRRLSDLHRSLSSEYLFGSDEDKESLLNEMKEAEERLEKLRDSAKGADVCIKCHGTGYSGGRVCDCVLPDIYVKCFGAEDVASFTESFDKSERDLYDRNEEIISGKSQYELYSLAEDSIIKYSERVFDGKGTGLLIMGATGLGKTFLCRALAAKAIQEKPVMFITAPELAADFLDHRRGEPVELKYIWQAPLLIVDDLGAETFSNNVTSEYLCELIEKRTANKLPTVFSTNLSIDDIKKRYGERISSRLASGRFMAFMLFGEDIRLKKRL